MNASARAAAPTRQRRVGRTILMIVLVLVVALVALLVYLDWSLKRVDAFGADSGRTADTPGTNWLLVGSDSREGLTADQADKLSTGDANDAGGQRTDTMMLLHIPDSGGSPTLVSLPRDSYLPIAGHGRNKLNAAFSLGGPQLLTKTVETATGVHVDHYAEIGFGGFAGVVDAIGGVEMCPDTPMKDPKAGLDIPAGCQTLDGATALGYVRTRASAGGDLDRIKHQREFLSALMHKATGFGVLINPFSSVPMAIDGTGALTVAEGDHLWNLAGLATAMRSVGDGGLVTTSVPVGRFGRVSGAGDVLYWDQKKAGTLFGALAKDQPVPQNVLRTG